MKLINKNLRYFIKIFLIKLHLINLYISLKKNHSDPYHKYFLKNKIIFIHIPKTAGNSVVNYLFDSTVGPGHYSASYYKNRSINNFNNFFKFAVIRNPWDRFVSAFFYLKQGGLAPDDLIFREKYLLDIDDFDSFVFRVHKSFFFRKIVMNWTHFIPQYKFITINGKIVVDKLIDMSNPNFSKEVSNLKNYLKYEPSNIFLKINKSSHVGYSSYYTEETKNIVASLYKEDIKLLDYEF